MNVEYINPFIESSVSVVQSICNISPEIGKIYLRDSQFTANRIVIIIGLTGKIKGQVYFELSEEDSLKIVARMTGFPEVKALDDIGKSAIAELGNMIMGNAGTILYNKGLKVDITPPSLVVGDNIKITNKTPTIVIPLDLKDYGTLFINISAAEIA